MEIIRRNLEAAHTEGRLGDAGSDDPVKPWDAVFLAANDSEFWTTEVAETAMLYIARVKDKDDLADPGHHVQVAGAAPGIGRRSGSGGFPLQPSTFTKAQRRRFQQKAAAAAAATKNVTEDVNKFVRTLGTPIIRTHISEPLVSSERLKLLTTSLARSVTQVSNKEPGPSLWCWLSHLIL